MFNGWFGNWFSDWFGSSDSDTTEYYFESLITEVINADSTLSNISANSILFFDLQMNSNLMIDILHDSDIMMLNNSSLISNSIIEDSTISINSTLESSVIDGINKTSSINTGITEDSEITEVVKTSTIYEHI